MGTVAVNFNDSAMRRRLESFIKHAARTTDASIVALKRMTGGAIQETCALDVKLDGQERHWVLRAAAQTAVRESLTRAEEFAVLKLAHASGIRAPEPLYLCEDSAIAGRAFFIMERLPGTAAGHKITRDSTLVPDPKRLAAELAVNLARIHRIETPQPQLAFLKTMLARDNIAHYRNYLDTLPAAHPVLEWGLRWCELHAPPREDATFIHRDYRTGNYLVDNGRLSGVLDWEFAAFGNPLEDLGWFCARCWRFARPDLGAGGIANTDDFVPEYERASGRRVSADDLNYWQIMAHLRWAIIALQQAERHLSGERSLELALTGRIVGELELEILNLTRET